MNRSSRALLGGCLVLLGCARVGGRAADAGGERSLDASATATDAVADVPGGSCPGGMTTTITGTAYAPNGILPLYNVVVYVPSAPLPAFTKGVSCDRCGGATVRAVAAAVSDERGEFRLTNVPAGVDIPLVFQVGKWRRKVTVPRVLACQENRITDPDLTRLPRNRQEGDLPKVAITTGLCDMIGCLLPKVGVDATEFGVAGDDKPVTFFRGWMPAMPPPDPSGIPLGLPTFPPNMTDAQALWRDESELGKYDMMLLSCECEEAVANKGAAAYDAMTRYLGRGGRIFGSDFMYVWYRYSPDPALAGALEIVGGAPMAISPMLIDTSFARGKALADWMKVVEPTVGYGQIPSEYEEIFANVTRALPGAQVWATSQHAAVVSGRPELLSGPRIVTINTPVSAPSDQQCGRAVHLDAHITPRPAVAPGDQGPRIPVDCGTRFNKGERALAFLFFDLAACVQKDTVPVVPPIVIP